LKDPLVVLAKVISKQFRI